MNSLRRQPARTGHRVGFGLVHQRLRRSSPVSFPHQTLPLDHIVYDAKEPLWLMETDMSDEHQFQQDSQFSNNYQPQPYQQDGYQQHNAHIQQDGHMQQNDQVQQGGYVQHTDFVPAHDTTHFDGSIAPVAEAAHIVTEAVHSAPVTVEPSRLDAIEAAIAELRVGLAELKASQTVAHVEPAAVVAHETHHIDTAPAHDLHADRLQAIEAALAEVKDSINGLTSHLATITSGISAVQSDVESHKVLHADTKALVDEQHDLMRGLNYIITSAIGSLTANAKAPK